MTPPTGRTNRQLIAAAFDQAAPNYDAAALLQQEVGNRFIEQLPLFKIAPRRILDLGCGTGQISHALADHYPEASITALDLAAGMVKMTRQRIKATGLGRWRRPLHHFLVGDAQSLPFADNSFELIASNLTFQWCRDLPGLFREIQRVLAPGGLLLFTTLGPDTLKELRASWQAVDATTHVNSFADMHDVGDAMLSGQLDDPVVDMEQITITYEQAITLMRDLKAIGAHNMNPERSRGLTSPRKLSAVSAAYEQFRMADGMLPATYEVIYGHAWRGEPRHSGAHVGDFAFNISDIKPFSG
jgi:malonyl-CoA O-methyltransferase